LLGGVWRAWDVSSTDDRVPYRHQLATNVIGVDVVHDHHTGAGTPSDDGVGHGQTGSQRGRRRHMEGDPSCHTLDDHEWSEAVDAASVATIVSSNTLVRRLLP